MSGRTALLLLCCVAAFAACRQPPRPAEQPEVVVANDRLRIRADSHLLYNLHVTSVQSETAQRTGLRMIGQIIALANPSVAPGGSTIDWLVLDSDILRTIKLDPERVGGRVGDVIGMTQLPRSYLDKVRQGERVVVGRYGVVSQTWASILAMRPSISWGEDVPVVFRIENDPSWLPGANCEVTFPLLKSQSVKIPTTALLHEGIHEYVFKEVGPNEFVPRVVTIGEGDPAEIEVVTGLSQGNRIIARGSILLKPFLHQWLASQGHPDAP